MNKNILKKAIDQAMKLEQEGDKCMQKEKLDSCISAIGFYLDAQTILSSAAHDDSLSSNNECGIKCNDVSIKSTYIRLSSKIDNANSMMLDPKLARR